MTTTYYNYLGQAVAVSADPVAFLSGNSAGGQTLTAPQGPSGVNVNGGNYDILIASNGDNTFYVNNITDVVQAASGLSGVKTVISYAGGYTLPANVQNLTFYGAGNWGLGNSGDNLIVMGGNDLNFMDGGGGNDVLVGGFGLNNFGFESGHDVVYNFHVGQDTMRLAAAPFTSFAQITAAMTQTGSDVVLRVDANNSVTFRGVSIADFKPANFLLPLDHSKLGAMTFDDEFNSLQLYDFGAHTGHWLTNFNGDPTKVDTYSITSNDEKEVYTDANFKGITDHSLGFNPFSIDNGVVDITAQNMGQLSQYAFGRPYSSGMLNTKGIFAQQYGFFEMRAELPTALGSWPGFWMSQDPYKPGVEADILEHLGMYPDANFVRVDDAGTVTGMTNATPGGLSGFHNYGMLWTATTTTFYIDDYAVMSVPTPASWDKPMYMIINLAIGGWGGPIDDSAYPAQMKVDWVHVYGLADNSQVVVNSTPTQATGSGSGTTTTPGSNVTITTNGSLKTANFSGSLSQYAVNVASNSDVTVTDNVASRDGTTSLTAVQQAHFTDYTLVFDLHSSQDLLVYELYQAAYGRTPDNAGFRYWAGQADASGASATVLADQFLSANEFTRVYGANPSNQTYVSELYQHVLGRQPDQAGLDYWVGQANAGMAKDALLVNFAISHENVQLIGSHISEGYWTT